MSFSLFVYKFHKILIINSLFMKDFFDDLIKLIDIYLFIMLIKNVNFKF